MLVALDARRLYLVEGYQSLFDFCQRRLRLSESEAYHRIEAARTARLFPVILERLRAGALTLSTVALLRPHLTEANHAAVLAWAEGRSKREVEVFVRTLDPRPDVRTSLRRLAEPRPTSAVGMTTPVPSVGGTAGAQAIAPDAKGADAAATNRSGAAETMPLLEGGRQSSVRTDAPALCWGSTDECHAAGVPSPVACLATAPCACAPPPRRPAEMRPLAPARYSLHLTISEDTRAKLRRAQALLWHAEPNADEALVLDRALTLLVETLERRKFGALKLRPPRGKPTARSRPATSTRGTRGPRVARAARREESCENRELCGKRPGKAALPA